MFSLRIISEARIERESIAEKYLKVSTTLVKDFEYASNRYIGLIQENPYLYQKGRFQIRKVTIRPIFEAYYVAYIIRRTEIIILAFGHAKRPPFYFKNRLKKG